MASNRKASIAFIGWQSEYQREYIWREKLQNQRMTQGGFNRNYVVKEDIINPRAPTHQTPVNHLTGKSKESVIPVPPTPSLYPDEEYYEDEYPPGYFDQDDDDNNDASPTPQQVSPTKSTFSEGPSHVSFSSHEAVFGSEPTTSPQKKGSFDRSVTVEPKEARPTTTSVHKSKQNGRTQPPMANYGSGNTNPATDEHFMKTFNAKVSHSE
ncbi:hypothetical protein HDU99_006233, partial [Rhizoclosmatium hyalinum]